MIRNIFKRLSPLLLLLVGAGTIFAQSTVTGGIIGTVTDPQGGVVPGASITATNINTNAVSTVTTNANGGYRVTNLQPGTYSVESAASGFAVAKAERVVVEVGQTTTVDILLSIGTATAEVEVTAEAPVINTNDNSSSTNINQTSINELPINGRRASNFVLLTPGVAPDGNFGLISFRGISGLLNNSTVDGGDNNQAFFSEERGRTRINYSISQDAVREFSVNTSNYSAEFGRAAGGVVNTVTKSGTNEFHGGLFYYNRNNEWGARNPLSFPSANNPTGKPEDIRHQFGGSIGGPIVKDKLFFFFSYDQQKRNFPAVAAPGLTTFFTNIPAIPELTQAQIDAGISYLQNLTGIVARKGDQSLYLPKIDWVINDRNTFTAVYNRMRWDSPGGVQTAAVVSRGRTSFGSDLVTIDTLNLRLNSSISSRVTNEARFQFSRDLEQQVADTPDPSEPTTGGGFPPSAAIGGNSGITIGKPNFLNRSAYPNEKRWQFADSVSMIRGKHSWKFGGDFNYVSDTLDSLFSESGVYVYSTLANWLIDFNLPNSKRYSSFQQGFGPTAFKFATKDYNLFVQDDIAVSPNLTINLGLRYEYQQMPEAQIPNALEPRTSIFPSDKNNFGPRAGFAYSFGRNNDNVVRGGYGIYYGRITNSAISNAITNTGVAEGQRQFFSTPNANTPTYPNVLATIPPIGGVSDIVVFESDMQNPLIHQADIIYERRLGRNTVVSVSGLLSKGRYLPYFVDTNLNPPNSTTTFTFVGGPLGGQTATVPKFTGPRPNTNFGRITEIRGSVSSNYYAMVLQANRRLTKGIQFQSSYTFSKATDNGQNSSTFTSANSPSNPFDLDAEQGRSNYDIPHRFVTSLVYAPDALFGVGRDSKAGRAIFGGWTIAPIFTAQSGFTYSGTTSGNVSGGTSSGPLGAGGSSRLPIFEPNTYRAPSIYNFDLRISRRIRFSETMNLELLAEGFNIFNTFHATGVNTRIYIVPSSGTNLNYDTGFAGVTAAGNSVFRERQVQLAARFQF